MHPAQMSWNESKDRWPKKQNQGRTDQLRPRRSRRTRPHPGKPSIPSSTGNQSAPLRSSTCSSRSLIVRTPTTPAQLCTARWPVKAAAVFREGSAARYEMRLREGRRAAATSALTARAAPVQAPVAGGGNDESKGLHEETQRHAHRDAGESAGSAHASRTPRADSIISEEMPAEGSKTDPDRREEPD